MVHIITFCIIEYSYLVRMMGTEGRVPGRELAPTNEIYDVVVFRSSDIDDLQIFEAPQQTPPPPPPQPFVDPAIVTSVCT